MPIFTDHRTFLLNKPDTTGDGFLSFILLLYLLQANLANTLYIKIKKLKKTEKKIK